MVHSANWDDSVELKGKRVAVIGGGSSAVQIVPNIQPSKLRPLFLRVGAIADDGNISCGQHEVLHPQCILGNCWLRSEVCR